MKKTLLFLVFLACLVITGSNFSVRPAHANVAGAPTSRTGSPFDVSSCTFCHAGTATTTPGQITSNIPLAGYMPGNTYTITATVTQASRIKFGFEISPQSSTGALLGTIIATNPTETQIIGLGKWITHRAAGTAGSGSRTWTFDWTAPPINSGTVTFYGAFNATNNSSSTSGDIIKLSTMVIPQDPSAGIFDPDLLAMELSLYPNPVSDKINLQVQLPSDGALVSIQDLSGRKVKEENFTALVSGNNQFVVDAAELDPGIYFLTVHSGQSSVTRKFFKQ